MFARNKKLQISHSFALKKLKQCVWGPGSAGHLRCRVCMGGGVVPPLNASYHFSIKRICYVYICFPCATLLQPLVFLLFVLCRRLLAYMLQQTLCARHATTRMMSQCRRPAPGGSTQWMIYNRFSETLAKVACHRTHMASRIRSIM